MIYEVDNFDWKNVIYENLLVLKSVGLWPKGNGLYNRDVYLVYALSLAVFLVAGFNLSQLINIYFIYTDFEVLTSSILLMTTNLLAITKMCLFLKNVPKIKNILNTLNTLDFRPKTPSQLELIKPSLKRWKRIYIWYHTVVIFNLLMWSVAPILGDLEEHRLPFAAWFPFDTQVLPNYAAAYVYQMVCMWPMSVCNMNLDCIVMALMMLLCVQCDLLCYNLRSLHSLSFDKELVECIKRHKVIVSLAKTSNDFFNWIILGQFATSTSVTALIMFQLTLVSPVSGEGLSHMFYIHGITTQIFLYCWFGNELEVKSSRIPNAVYESNWIYQPPKVKRNIIFFCIRCQRPIKITAIKLFSLSLQTFIAIMRSAYSYFALLSNVNA
ncbi:odorant receptor Or1-like [Zophobas morio]|uniref:odorant receptor Or1-like n=1 Tax=Zophobas morio TaxID=2755281 RepID=UPI0030827902